METNQSIEQVLETTHSPLVYKKKKSILISVIYILLGISFLVMNSLIDITANSIMPSLFFMSGSIFLVLGILTIFFRKNLYFFVENNQELKSYPIYFDLTELNKLVRMIESGDINDLKTLKPSAVHALKLHVMITKDAGLCFTQVVLFKSNESDNITPVKQHNFPESQELLEIIKRK